MQTHITSVFSAHATNKKPNGTTTPELQEDPEPVLGSRNQFAPMTSSREGMRRRYRFTYSSGTDDMNATA